MIPGWRARLGAVPIALLVTAAVEAARLPLDVYRAAPAHAARVLACAIGYGCALLAGPILFQSSAAAAHALRGRGRLGPRAHAVVALALCAAAAGSVYAVLARDAALRGHAPLIGALAALAAVLAWTALGRHRGHRPAAAAAGLGGFAAAYAANARLLAGDYFALHLAALQGAHLLLQIGLAAALAPWLDRPRAFRAVAAAGGAVALAAALAVGAGWCRPALPEFLDRTTLGQSAVVFRAAVARARGGVLDEPDAPALFARASGLPPLPEGFRLQDHNVLLIMGEAVRFDQTSLADPALGTTPALLAWRERATPLSFSRAYAPSTGTFQSVAAMLAMTYPSAVHLRTWNRPWVGELFPDNLTVPELFSAAGHATFWVGHNLLDFFGRAILGFEQGFAERTLIPATRESAGTDAAIADAAIARLGAAARGRRRFFGWVFFVSPHEPYLVHDRSRPARTQLHRYRQEIAAMDAQIGRVLDALDRLGLAERTIVVVTGDHGEEFGEHGGRSHTKTVYGEQAHVPLLVRVPGVPGGPVAAPVSTGYLFPWLLLRGGDAMSAAARERLRREVGPMLRATGGAVLVELLGHDRMQSSLVYADYKVNYRFRSRRHELYALAGDPLEQRDLFARRPDLARRFAARVRRYLEVRETTRRFLMDPARRAPRAWTREPR